MESPERNADGPGLAERLGHVFRRPELLTAALTHRSHAVEAGRPEEAENQRLEFLGDAVLGAIAAEWLVMQCPDWREGTLTKVRSRLTNAAALGRVARRLGLGAVLRLGRGEEQTGGRDKNAVLADALEAVLGALWLDGGESAVRAVFATAFADEIAAALAAGADDNPKGELQELVQRKWKEAPRYELQAAAGPAHARHFQVAVFHGPNLLGQGIGASKRAAEQDAARKALLVLNQSNDKNKA